jgi:anti-sigma factor RsiW
MTQREYIALIHAEIDGELDAANRAELARHLLADPDARALREDLRRVCNALDGLPEVEPPAQLRQSILAALPQSSVKRPGLASPYWRLAAVIATVMLAGAIVFETLKGAGPAAGNLSGTIAAQTPAIVATVRLGDGPVAGRASLLHERAQWAVEFDLASSAPADVLIVSGAYSLRVNGIAGPDKAGGPPRRVTLSGFQASEQPVELRFLVAEKQVASATLRQPATR